MGLMTLTTTIRLLALAALAMALPLASGQQPAASCTTSLLTSFTPCFSFLTSNSSGTTAPTRECCRSLAALVNASTGCACLVLTGAVPLPALGGAPVPVNRTLAVSLPRACGSASVPLQCRDTSSSAQSPAPGPVADTPPATTTPASPAATTPTTPATPTVDPTATAPVTQRPTVLPNTARRTASAHVAAAPALLLLLAVGAALV